MTRKYVKFFNSFGLLLATARESKGLSQKDLSDKSKVSLKFISMVENGEGNPSIKTLLKLCDALGVNMSDLISKSNGASKTKTSRINSGVLLDPWGRRLLSRASKLKPDKRRALMGVVTALSK